MKDTSKFLRDLKGLFEDKQYQDILIRCANFDEDEKFVSLSIEGQKEYLFYKSRALAGIEQYETAAVIFIYLHNLHYNPNGISAFGTIDNARNAAALNNIGTFYGYIGELEKSLEYYQLGLRLYESISNSREVAGVLRNIGSLYWRIDDLDTALTYLHRSLRTLQSIGNDIATSDVIFDLFILVLDQKDQAQAQSYLDQLQIMYARTPNKFISQASRLAKALLLKHSLQMKNVVQAQEILSTIVEEDLIDFDLTVLAIIHLCEIQLIELKTMGDSKILEEIKILLEKLSELAKKHQSFSLVVETMLLRTKFVIIDGDLQSAMEFLNQARIIAEENDLRLLLNRISNEQKTLSEEYGKWESLIQTNAPIQERLEMLRLEEYIRGAKELAVSMKFSASEFSFDS